MRGWGAMLVLLALAAAQSCAEPCANCQVARRVASAAALEALDAAIQTAAAVCVERVDPEFVGDVRAGSRTGTDGFRNLTLAFAEVRLPGDEHDPAVVVEIVDRQREHYAFYLRNGFGADVRFGEGCFLGAELNVRRCDAANSCSVGARFSIEAVHSVGTSARNGGGGT